MRVEGERVQDAGFAVEHARMEEVVDVLGEVVIAWDVGWGWRWVIGCVRKWGKESRGGREQVVVDEGEVAWGARVWG